MDDSELRIHDKIEMLRDDFKEVLEQTKLLNRVVLILLVSHLGADGTRILQLAVPSLFPEQTINVREKNER